MLSWRLSMWHSDKVAKNSNTNIEPQQVQCHSEPIFKEQLQEWIEIVLQI